MESPLEPPHFRRLVVSARAQEHRRHLFHPRSGWFRRLERNASILLSRHLYPKIPLLPAIYDRQLHRQLTLAEADLDVAGLPAPFDGLRILLLTDLHVGPFVSPQALDLACSRLRSCRPDLILVGGDIVTSDLAELKPNLDVLTRLEAPLGVFGVLGNHDHYTHAGAVIRAEMERVGIRMLHNTSVFLTRGGASITLAGVDDMNAGEPDLAAAMAGSEEPVIVLSHNPDLFFEAVDLGAAAMLSGHTHGGQIRWPGHGVIVRQSRYHLDDGRYHYRGAGLIVSRGLGVTGVPLRLGCPPEGVLVRLQRAARASTRPGESASLGNEPTRSPPK